MPGKEFSAAGNKVKKGISHSPGTTSPATPFDRSSSDGADLHDRIAARAYELFEHRGYQDGQDLEDWLRAEREIQNP